MPPTTTTQTNGIDAEVQEAIDAAAADIARAAATAPVTAESAESALWARFRAQAPAAPRPGAGADPGDVFTAAGWTDADKAEALAAVLRSTVFHEHSRAATEAQALAHADDEDNAVPLGAFPLALLPAAEPMAAATFTVDGGPEVQHRTEMPVFDSELARAFGVQRQMVGTGTHNIPVTTDFDPPSATVAKGTDVSDSSVTITATAYSGGRLQFSMSWAKEDAASFEGLAADAGEIIRRAIEAGVDSLDSKLLAGAGTAPSAETTLDTFASVWKKVTDSVDGKFADSARDLAVLAGVDSWAFMSGLWRSNETDMTVADRIEDRCRALMASGKLAAADATSKAAEIVIVRGAQKMPAARRLIWNNATLITDPYTRSGQGEIRSTFCVLTNGAILRGGQIVRRSLKIAS